MLRRLRRFQHILRNLQFEQVNKTDIVVYDAFSERHLFPLLDMTRVTVFDVALESVNLWIAVRSLRYGIPSVETYLLAFVATTRPRVVITTSDNSINFYSIKSHFPEVITIAIQNGRRNTFGPKPNSSFQNALRHKKISAQVDYYFTFGTTEMMQFEHLIDGKFVCHGNLKNNYLAHVKRLGFSDKKILSYISSLPSFLDGNSATIDSEVPTHFFGDTPLSHQSYFEPEGRVAKFLHDYCEARGFKFQVIGKRDEKTPQETEYFRKVVGDESLQVIQCSPEGASYRALIDSDFVFSIDSTLAYEMFGRGIRTGFLTMRAAAMNISGLKCPNFGFPEVTAENGPFWTNLDDEKEFARVFDFVTTCSDAAWSEASARYKRITMNLDQDNSTLYSLLTDLGVSHRLGIPEIRRRAEAVYGVG